MPCSTVHLKGQKYTNTKGGNYVFFSSDSHAPSFITASHICTLAFSVSHNGSGHLKKQNVLDNSWRFSSSFWRSILRCPLLLQGGSLSSTMCSFYLFLLSKLILSLCSVICLCRQQLSQSSPAEPSDTSMPSLQRAGVRHLHTGDLLHCLTGFDTIFQLYGLRFFSS